MRVLSLLVALVLGACSGYTLVEPERFAVGDHYTVEPQTRWSRLGRGHTEIWTIDGPLLQQVRFVKALEDGEKLFPGGMLGDRRRERRKPSFRSNMTPVEVVEFFEDSLSQTGATNVRTFDLRPSPFGPYSGFRFAFDYALADGLERTGFAVAAIHDARLHMIIYAAPRLFYFGRDKDHVERLIRSVRPMDRP